MMLLRMGLIFVFCAGLSAQICPRPNVGAAIQALVEAAAAAPAAAAGGAPAGAPAEAPAVAPAAAPGAESAVGTPAQGAATGAAGPSAPPVGQDPASVGAASPAAVAEPAPHAVPPAAPAVDPEALAKAAQAEAEAAAAQKAAAEAAAKAMAEQQARQMKQQAIQMAVQQISQRLQQQAIVRSPDAIIAARARLALARVDAERRKQAQAAAPARTEAGPTGTTQNPAAAAGEGGEADVVVEEIASDVEEIANEGGMVVGEGVPAELLQAMAARGRGGVAAPGAPPTIDTEEYFDLLVAGEWAALGPWLKDNLEAQAANLYNQTLQALIRWDEVLAPVDVLPIADMFPGEKIEPAAVQSLGRLIQAAQARGSVAPLVLKIREGTKWFGGADREPRDRAADLLIAAGLLDEAKEFLPSLEEGVPSAELLTRHGNHARWQAEKADAAADARGHYLRAFELWQRAADHAKATAAERRHAIAQQIAVASFIPETTAAEWRQTLFVKTPELGLAALADLARGLGRPVQNPQQRGGWQPPESASQLQQRARTLESIAGEVERLLVVCAGDLARWDAILDLLAQAWNGEVSRHIANQGPSFARKDEQDDGQIYWGRQMPRAISAEELQRSAPSKGWQARLAVLRRGEVLTGITRLAARLGNAELGLQAIREIQGLDPKVAKQAADFFVDDFRLSLNPGTEAYGERQVYYVNGMRQVFYTGGRGSETPPITRTQQVSGLAALEAFFKALKEASIGPIDHKIAISTFAACHSAAEVYRRQDIEALFGPIPKLKAELASELAERMRLNLAERWRKPEIQRAAGTRRTGPEILSELRRGFELALELAESAGRGEAVDPGRRLASALLRYDFASFLESQKTTREVVDPIVRAAFDDFRGAASAYHEAVIAERHPLTAQYHASWFLASLGATDVAYIARDAKQNDDEVGKLAQAIQELPEPLRETHRGALAEMFETIGARAPAVIKPRFVRHALRLVGAHPKARSLARIGKIYEEVAREVELAITLDGSSEVGHNRLFGVRIGVRFTSALARETGGFNRYLQNNYYTNNVQVNYRNDFEKFVRDALKERFRIESFVFHDPEDAPRWFGRAGWVEQPMAYVVLAATDPSADQIPVISFDMDFNDGQGTAIIPILSEPVPLRAAEAHPPVRPVEALEVDCVLDDRSLAERGELFLEVRMKGKGVLPSPDQLADFQVAGFDLTKIEEHGTNVVELDPESALSTPKSERSFTVHWKDQDRSATAFAYPRLLVDGQLVTRRYSDRDIVPAEGIVTLKRGQGPGLSPWLWTLLLIPVAGFLGWRSLRPRAAPVTGEAAVPAVVTPLSTLLWLTRLRDRRDALNSDQLKALSQDIETLERAHFAKASSDATPDLAAILQRWSSAAPKS